MLKSLDLIKYAWISLFSLTTPLFTSLLGTLRIYSSFDTLLILVEYTQHLNSIHCLTNIHVNKNNSSMTMIDVKQNNAQNQQLFFFSLSLSLSLSHSLIHLLYLTTLQFCSFTSLFASHQKLSHSIILFNHWLASSTIQSL